MTLDVSINSVNSFCLVLGTDFFACHNGIIQKNEILDSVYFSYYRALKRKRRELVRLGLFEEEKKRLNRLGKQKKLPGREKYKKELINIIKKRSQ